MFKKNVLLSSLSAVAQWDIFVITEKLKNLSLRDDSDSDSESSQSAMGKSKKVLKLGCQSEDVLSYPRRDWKNYITSGSTSDFTLMLMRHTQSAFLSLPPHILGMTHQSKDFILNLGFRILPEQVEYIQRELFLEQNYKERLKDVKRSLGLTLSWESLSQRAALKYNTAVSNADRLYNRLLIEVITFNSGLYGRYFILVHLGVGCTVWYGFCPGHEDSLPVYSSLFSEDIDFTKFIHYPETHVQPGFLKIEFQENVENLLPVLAETYQNVKPFKDLNLPQSGFTLMACALGLTIAVFLSLGIPTESPIGTTI